MAIWPKFCASIVVGGLMLGAGSAVAQVEGVPRPPSPPAPAAPPPPPPPPPAPEQSSQLLDAKRPEAIEAILKGFGIARVETDSVGDPKISGRSDGKAYTVYFYGCKENKDCTNIQFWTYWSGDVPLERINQWNRDTRFGKLYLDSDNDLALVLDVNMLFGISEKTLEDTMDVWVTLVSRVDKEVVAR